MMALNTESIVPHLRRDFETLVDYVSGSASAKHTVYTVELHLFRRLLALGVALLGLFFRTRAAVRPPTPVPSDGQPMACQGRRSVRYISIFGALWVPRHYFTASGHARSTPLDAELSLPATAYSDLLREWGAYGDTEQAYRENQTLLERLLERGLSSNGTKTRISDIRYAIRRVTGVSHAQPSSSVRGAVAGESAKGRRLPRRIAASSINR